MEIVTLTNQKGGVAKTTTSYALGVGLYNAGKRVLLVDMDAQSNLSFTAGVDLNNLQTSLYDVFKGKADIKAAIQPLKVNGLDIVTSGIEMAGADMEFIGIGRESLLSEQLEKVKDNYDYCIIDTPPTLGVLTMNALTASNKAIIPLYADAYSIQGITQLSKFIASIQKHYNSNLTVAGLLLTKYNDRTVITQLLMNNVKTAAETLKTKVYDTKIRNTVAVQESQLAQQDLYTSAPTATATADYKAFVKEFLND